MFIYVFYFIIYCDKHYKITCKPPFHFLIHSFYIFIMIFSIIINMSFLRREKRMQCEIGSF